MPPTLCDFLKSDKTKQQEESLYFGTTNEYLQSIDSDQNIKEIKL